MLRLLVIASVVFSFSLGANTDHGSTAGVSAEKALGWLKNGNTRFLKGNFRKDGRKISDIKELAKGQHPHTIVISCADSRVPPEIIFDQVPGEIFVIRGAGQALDSTAIASAEYAASHLGSKLVLVLGHTKCGAVKAAVETPEGKSAGSADLDKLVGDIKPRLPHSEKASANLMTEVTANAKGVAEDLTKRSTIFKKMLADGSITVKSAVYDLETGSVNFH